VDLGVQQSLNLGGNQLSHGHGGSHLEYLLVCSEGIARPRLGCSTLFDSSLGGTIANRHLCLLG
jgi:hypothetical protein